MDPATACRRNLTKASPEKELVPRREHAQDKPTDIQLIQKGCTMSEHQHWGKDLTSKIGWNDSFVAIRVPVVTTTGGISDYRRSDGTQSIGFTKTALPTWNPVPSCEDQEKEISCRRRRKQKTQREETEEVEPQKQSNP